MVRPTQLCATETLAAGLEFTDVQQPPVRELRAGQCCSGSAACRAAGC